MSNLVDIIFEDPTVGHVRTVDGYGCKQYVLVISHDVLAAIDWIRDYRIQLQKEANARANNPALASCYHEYQTMLKLISD